MSSRPSEFLLLLMLGAVCLGPAPALANWSSPPNGQKVARFAHQADSALVWSISLPDSATAGKLRGREVLGVASVRADAVQPRAWARDLARRLFDLRMSVDHCHCDPIRRAEDSTVVVAPVVEFRIGDQRMWVYLSFPDTCGLVFLEQGMWGRFRLQDREKLLESIRAALPAEPMFASSGLLLPRPRLALKRTAPQLLATRSMATPSDSGEVEELPEAIERVPPVYPAQALAEGRSGDVVIHARVNKNGRVAETYIAWSVPYFDEAAVDAVKRWRFKPASRGGKPIEVWVTVPVRFTFN